MTIKQLDKFRLQAKYLFLTYPNCGLNLDDVLKQLKNKKNLRITDYALSKELHESGEPHIHVYLQLLTKKDIKSANFLDLVDVSNDISFHGNYQSVKFSEKSLAYVCKDFSEKEQDNNIIVSANIINLRCNLTGEIIGLDERLIQLGENGQIGLGLDLLKRFKPAAFLRSHDSYEKSLRSMHLRSKGIVRKFNFKDFIIPDDLLYKFQKDLNKTIYLQGDPGTGKTKFIQTYLIEILKLNPLIINNYDGLRYFVEGVNDCIILDDVDLKTCSREQVIKLLDSEDAATFDVKHSSVRIPSGIRRYVLSNLPIEQCVNFKLDQAIIRRIQKINLGGILLYSV